MRSDLARSSCIYVFLQKLAASRRRRVKPNEFVNMQGRLITSTPLGEDLPYLCTGFQCSRS